MRLIHDALVDLLENEYLDKAKDLLVARICWLIHTAEGLPQCGEYRCKLQRKCYMKTKTKKQTFKWELVKLLVILLLRRQMFNVYIFLLS